METEKISPKQEPRKSSVLYYRWALSLLFLVAFILSIWFGNSLAKSRNKGTNGNSPVKAGTKNAIFPDTKITGEVFIVLKNRETLKLSLVDVRVISGYVMELITATNNATQSLIVSNAFAEVWAEMPKDSTWKGYFELLNQSVKRLRFNIADAGNAAVSARRRVEEGRVTISLLAAIQANLKPSDYPEFQSNEYKIKQARQMYKFDIENAENADKAKTEWQTPLKVLEKAQAEFVQWLQFASVKKVTTDSDGKFILTVPSGENYFIFATASREMGGTSEDYLWLIPLSREENQQVTLSNNNLVN